MGWFCTSKSPAVPAVEDKNPEISPVDEDPPQSMCGEAQDGGGTSPNPILEVPFPLSLSGHGVEGAPGQAPLHNQGNPCASWIISSPEIPLSAGWATCPPNCPSFCVSSLTPRWCLTWQVLHDSTEITPEHGKSNLSLSQQPRLLQRKAGETQEQRQSQRNLSQKGYSTEMFILPRHLEADFCTQTQHFTSAHSLILLPGLPY